MTATDPTTATDASSREPLLWVTSTSSWEDEAIISRLLPPAAVLDSAADLATPPPNPYLVVVARETQPACEVLLRQYGMVTDRDGTVRQHVADGWIIAATILIATAPGKQDKEFRNYAAALADDQQRVVMRIPFIREWRLLPIVELPQWDFTPTPRSRAGRGRRPDGLPVTVADGFDQIMAHVAGLAASSDQPSADSVTTTSQCA